MAYEDFQIASPANLSGGLLSGGTALCIYSGVSWPVNLSGSFRVTVDKEIIRLQGQSGFVFPIIQRGAEGTTEADHQDYAQTIHTITAQGLKNLTGGVNRQSGAAYTFGAADARACVLFHTSGVAPVSGILPQTTSGDTSDFGPHYWTIAYNRSSGALNIVPASGTVNGAANLLLDGGANKAAFLFSDGTVAGNWAAIVTQMSGGGSSFSLTSGCIVSGMIGNGAVVSGSIASGQIGPGHLSSGILQGVSGVTVTYGQIPPQIQPPIAPVGVSEMRLTLDSTNSFPSQEIYSINYASGRTTSGSTVITRLSGSVSVSGVTSTTFNSGFLLSWTAGTIVVGSGIPTGTFLTSTSGFTTLEMSQAATASTSGATIQFIPGAVYSLPYAGNRVIVANSGGNNMRYLPWISGPGTRCLLYDNQQSILALSGATQISGLTDTYQLARGMLAILSGILASGSTISSIDSATSVTLSKAALSGTVSGALGAIFAIPISGAANSGFAYDMFVTVRSGVPWLRLGSQWTTTTSRFTDIAR